MEYFWHSILLTRNSCNTWCSEAPHLNVLLSLLDNVIASDKGILPFGPLQIYISFIRGSKWMLFSKRELIWNYNFFFPGDILLIFQLSVDKLCIWIDKNQIVHFRWNVDRTTNCFMNKIWFKFLTTCRLFAIYIRWGQVCSHTLP